MELTCRDTVAGRDRTVMIADFLTVEPGRRYQQIVMDPPFTRGAFHKHFGHAKEWLSPHGLLFAIVPDNNCTMPSARGAVTVRVFPTGWFRESRTNVANRLVRMEESR